MLKSENSEGKLFVFHLLILDFYFSQNDEVEPLLLAQSEDEQEHLRNTEK